MSALCGQLVGRQNDGRCLLRSESRQSIIVDRLGFDPSTYIHLCRLILRPHCTGNQVDSADRFRAECKCMRTVYKDYAPNVQAAVPLALSMHLRSSDAITRSFATGSAAAADITEEYEHATGLEKYALWRPVHECIPLECFCLCTRLSGTVIPAALVCVSKAAECWSHPYSGWTSEVLLLNFPQPGPPTSTALMNRPGCPLQGGARAGDEGRGSMARALVSSISGPPLHQIWLGWAALATRALHLTILSCYLLSSGKESTFMDHISRIRWSI